MTKPEDIKEPNYLKIYNKLKDLPFPCVLVVYGAERTHRTTYRGEHESQFTIGQCENVDDAWHLVDCGYRGYPPDFAIYYIHNNELHQLQ